MRSDLREFLGLGVGKGGVHTGWWVLWIVGLGLVWSDGLECGSWERSWLLLGLEVGGLGETLARFVGTGVSWMCLMEGDSVREARWLWCECVVSEGIARGALPLSLSRGGESPLLAIPTSNRLLSVRLPR